MNMNLTCLGLHYRRSLLLLGVLTFSVSNMAGSRSADAFEVVYGVTRNQFLVSWNADSPANLLSGVAISGMQQNETVLGIDFRPSTRELFVLGSTNRLYTADTATGVLTMVGSDPFATPLDGSAHGLDFNPVSDLIRVATDTNRSYSVNPDDASITRLSDIYYSVSDAHAGSDPSVVHLAYTHSFPGATSTTLYGVDTGLDVLVTQEPDSGMLTTVAPLDIDMNDAGGFDISGNTGNAYMVIGEIGLSRSTFWTLNLQTGTATSGGRIGGGSVITAIAVLPIPEPATLGLFCVGMAAVLFRARHR